MLRHNVDAALASFFQIGQRILRPVRSPGKAYDEDRRVVVDALEVAKGREVLFASLGQGADESYGSRDNAGDQKRVVVEHGSPLSERIDLDMSFG
jgi:hypothetical protein